jgi:hypothetical protein
MLKLRKFLCRTFGFLAVLFSLVAYPQMSQFVQDVHNRSFMQPATDLQLSSALIALRVVLLTLAELLHLMPIILTILYGMAWWSVRRKKSSARGWALAASSALAFLAVPFSIVAYFSLRYSSQSAVATYFVSLSAVLVAPGVAGVIAFAAKDSFGSPEIGPAARPPRIAGDGTSNWLDRAIWVIAVAGYYLGQVQWYRWGSAHDLPFIHGVGWWALFAAAMLIETTAHESGHALVGMAVGMRLRAFIVWPFQWVFDHGKWRFQIQPGKIFNFGGAAALVPTNPKQQCSGYISMIAAGPLASLLVGCIAFLLARKVPGTEIEWTWEFFALVSTLGLVLFVVNLIPARPEALYTDGARIYQLLGGGAWADYHCAVSAASSGTVTPLRPRDYDIEAIRRASASIAQGHPGLLLRLLAYNHFRDCNQMPDSCNALAEAESVWGKSEIELPAQLCAHFVIGKAFVAHDSAAARAWWDRMQSKKTGQLDNELYYWEAKCALEIGEGNLEAANEAWEKGNEIAQQRPRAGAYDYDRDCFAEMHKAIQCNTLRECVVEPV